MMTEVVVALALVARPLRLQQLHLAEGEIGARRRW